MSTQSKHTPGPWSNNKWNCEEHQISAKGGTIALVSHGHSLVSEAQSDANARLIATAPELLEALKECLRDVATPISDHPWAIKQRNAHTMARAAIAKAEGL